MHGKDDNGNQTIHSDVVFVKPTDIKVFDKNVENASDLVNSNISNNLKAHNVFAYLAAYEDNFIEFDEFGEQQVYPCLVLVYEDSLHTRIEYIGYDILDDRRVRIYTIGEDVNSFQASGLFVNMLRDKINVN